MEIIAAELSKYILTILMAVYTFQCFLVFKFHHESERHGIYVRQNAAMVIINLIAFTVLYLGMEDNTRLPVVFLIGQLTTTGVIIFYSIAYKGANRLIVNNMCMLLTVSFIILIRLSFDKALKQIMIAIASLILTSVIPYILMKFKNLRRFYYLFAGLGIFMLLVVLVFSTAIHGSKLSINIGGVTFQPSEFVKLSFVFAIAGMLARAKKFTDIVITALIAGAHIIILVLSRDLGSALIYFVVYITMLFIATGSYLFLFGGLTAGVFAAGLGYKLFSHVRVRVEGFRDPLGTIDNAGYQISQSLFAIGTGGFFGMGLLQGAPEKTPVAASDFIFAAICEELGVLFGICLILVCVSIFVMFMNISMKFTDLFYKLVAVGLSMTYGVQVFLNIGGVTKFIPLTGVTLPLVSYGGNSIMVSVTMFSIIQGMYNAFYKDNTAFMPSSAKKAVNPSPVLSDRVKENKGIVRVTSAFVLLFILMIVNVGYFTGFNAPDFINSPYNTRQELFAKKVVRGRILSRNRDILAQTIVNDDGTETRSYPYKNLFAHSVGFSDKGRSGIELQQNFTLLTSDSFFPERINNTLNGRKNPGDNVITTLDLDMQAAAYKGLGSHKGAVIALEADTGKILCMVSKPDFDPNSIAEAWDKINEDQKNGALVNRATQGLYPPGSTFKIVTMLEFIRENSPEAFEDYSFDCKGSFSDEGYTINCYHGQEHGVVNAPEAFAKSCNSAFAQIGVSLDKKAFRDTCEELLFNNPLPLKLPYKQSYVPINPGSDKGELMQTAIGQGKSQSTPIHIAMITQAIANDGILMEPYLIDHIENAGGDRIKSYSPKEYGRLMQKDYSDRLCELMTQVVEEGTATRLKNNRYTAAGKTGSAEYSSNKVMSHAWFTGFAPAEDPKVVVTVIAEEAGSGGQFAVPVAKAVLDAYFGI